MITLLEVTLCRFRVNRSCYIFNQVRWAPGAGVKNSQFSDYFDVESGVTYIPWNKLSNNLATLSDGGSVDETTLPTSNQQGKCEGNCIQISISYCVMDEHSSLQ